MRYETLYLNGFRIILPIGLPCVLDTPVRDSYQEFLKNDVDDVRRHLTAVATLLPPVLRECKPVNVLHAFGGVGATAQVIDQVLGPDAVRHSFWDRDEILVNYLLGWFPTSKILKVEDSFEQFLEEDLEQYDALLMDMSVGTIKTPGVKRMWGPISKWMAPNRFVWFTDTACHKIHLNYKTYAADFGVEVEPTAESYLNAYSAWLEKEHRITITSAMREAGEYYCVVRNLPNKRFTEIGYL